MLQICYCVHVKGFDQEKGYKSIHALFIRISNFDKA